MNIKDLDFKIRSERYGIEIDLKPYYELKTVRRKGQNYIVLLGKERKEIKTSAFSDRHKRIASTILGLIYLKQVEKEMLESEKSATVQ